MTAHTGFSPRAQARRFSHLYKAVFRQHHQALASLLAPYIPEEGVVFDVGGHAGQFCKLFAGLAPAGSVFVFEPARYARSILQVMVGLKNLSNVFVLPFGLGEAPGQTTLNVPLKKGGSIGFGLSFVGAATAQDDRFVTLMREKIFITTIDAMVSLLQLERLDFIKADIEGFEFFMLKGSVQSLERFQPVVLLELNDRALARHGQTFEQVMAFMSARGYAASVVNEKTGTVAPIAPDVREGDFLFLPRRRA